VGFYAELDGGFGGNKMKRVRNQATIISFPLIDYNTGEYFTGEWDSLTNAEITAIRYSDTTTPVEHVISGTPVLVGNFWYLQLSQEEMNIDSQYLAINIDADELADQGLEIELMDELPETAIARIEASILTLGTAVAACLQSSEYTAPDNGSIAAIKTKTDNLPASPANESTLSTGIEALLDAIADCLQAADYTAPDDTAIRADIAALNNISVEDITGSTPFKQLLSAAKGKFTKSGSAYTFYDSDGTTALFTLTISDTGRTVS
jgi:hypothetical protein